MKIATKRLVRIIKEEAEKITAVVGKGRYSEEDLLDLYIDNPIDFTMPPEIHDHPTLKRARREIFTAKYHKCAGTEEPPDLGDWTEEGQRENDIVIGIKRKREEIKKVAAEIDSKTRAAKEESGLSGKGLIRHLEKDPEFVKLRDRFDQLASELKSADSDEFESGRRTSQRIRRNLEGFRDHHLGPCSSVPRGLPGGMDILAWKDIPIGAATSAMEAQWMSDYRLRYQPRRHQEESSPLREKGEEIMKITKNQLIKIIKEETEKKLKEDMSEPPPMMPGSDPRFNGPGTPAEGWERTALREIDKIIQTVKSNKSLGMKPEIALSAIEEIRKITRSALFPTYEKS